MIVKNTKTFEGKIRMDESFFDKRSLDMTLIILTMTYDKSSDLSCCGKQTRRAKFKI